MSLNRSALIASRARFRTVDEVRNAFTRQLLAGAQAVSHHEQRPAATNLLEWCKTFMPHYFSLEPSRQHIFTAQQLQYSAQKRGQNFVLEGPRDSAKSTLMTFGYPLWATCEGLETYILLMADTGPQAQKYLEAVAAELEHNSLIRKYYPDAAGIGPIWNKLEIVTNSGIRIAALGATSSVRGLRYMQNRPSCVIADDPEGEQASFSVTRRTRVRDWYTKGVLSVGSPTCNYFLAGTRIHRECLTAHMSTKPFWSHKAFKAITRWPDNMELWNEWERFFVDQEDAQRDQTALAFYDKNKEKMTEGAEVLWTQRKDLYTLMCKRASIGHTAFESEYQNNPIDPTKCEWSPDLFEGDELWFDEWPEDLEAMVIALDPSKGKSDKQGDYQALVAMGWRKGLLYIDADVARRPIRDMMDTFLAWGTLLRPECAVCEAEQFQEVLMKNLDDDAKENGLPFVVEPIETEGVNKKVRIRRMSAWISQRRMRFKRRSLGVRTLLNQLQDFPQGDHDDAPDACEMALRKLLEYVLGDKGAGITNPY